MEQYIGKTVDILLDEMWGQSPHLSGKLVAVEKEGWVVQATHRRFPNQLPHLGSLLYVPTRLVVLASISEE